MAYEALYRRYRPGRFADVTGQHHVMQALRNAVAHDRVGHAYMFSGPRGTGKTTSARILAKALNCTNRAPGEGEPCDVCPSCLNFQAGTSYDLRELDAASNNGVEAMRDLISKVGLSAGGHGVFILDEAHMLSTGAENALLKTLEEPPPNVTFILCTTEPNKVVPTIRSRTQHFDFSLLSGDELDGLVREVLTADGVTLADDDIDYVVRAGKGSARDTLSALDQVIAAGGAPQAATHGEALLQAIADGDTAAVLVATQENLRTGRDPELVGRDLLDDLRNAFLATMRADLSHLSETDRASASRWADAFSPAAITRAVELLGAALVSMRQAPDPRVDLEVALVRLTRPELDADPAALLARIERLESGAGPNPAMMGTTPPQPAPGSDTATAASGSTSAAPETAPPPSGTDYGDQPPADAEPLGAQAEDAPPPLASMTDPHHASPEPPAAAPAKPEAARAAAQAPAAAGSARRPADAARQTLRKVKGDNTAPEAESIPAAAASKQTLGSMRGTATRSDSAPTGESSPAPQPSVESDTAHDPLAPSDTAAPAPPPAAADSAKSAEPGTSDGDPPAAPSEAPSNDPVPPAQPSPATAVDRVAAETAWEDGLLDSLPGNVKARFSAAEFVDGPGDSIYMALPNDIHRQRCEDVRQPVDEAFAHRFGQPVPLTLVTEGAPVSSESPATATSAAPSAPTAAPSGTPAPTAAPAPPPPPEAATNLEMRAEAPPAAYDATSGDSDPYPEEAIDMNALTDATDVSSSVIDRITETFPGTEILDEGNEAP